MLIFCQFGASRRFDKRLGNIVIKVFISKIHSSRIRNLFCFVEESELFRPSCPFSSPTLISNGDAFYVSALFSGTWANCLKRSTKTPFSF